MALRMGRPWPRLVAMSRSGRFVALRGRSTIELVDALGTAPRAPIPADAVTDVACVGSMLWLLEGNPIRRMPLDSARAIEPAIELPHAGTALETAVGDNAHNALVLGPRPMLAHGLYDRVNAEAIDAGDARVFTLHGRRLALAGNDG